MRMSIGKKVIISLVLIVFIPGWSHAKDKSNEYWYYVKIIEAKDSYGFFGSSSLDEKQFAKKLNDGEYVLLENIVYYDSQKKIKSWSEWRPDLKPRVYLNPRYVVAFQPMIGDPRKKQR